MRLFFFLKKKMGGGSSCATPETKAQQAIACSGIV